MKIYKVLLIASMGIALLSGCVNKDTAGPASTKAKPGCTGQTGVLQQITHQKS